MRFFGKKADPAVTTQETPADASDRSASSRSGSIERKLESSSAPINEKTTNAAVETAPLDLNNVPGDEVVEKRVEAISADEQAEEAAEEAEDESQYPQALKLTLISIALCLAVFCVALDNTIISTAIPRITDQFNSINDVGWYGSSYLLTTCAFQLFFGKLYTFFNIKYVYLSCILVFEIGSAVCGAAPNSPALIVGRAIAGLGSGGIFSGAILIIANTVPLRKRPGYMGLIGGMYGLASVAGPLMGGAFTTKVSWRWCFYINLPIGAVTLAFITFFYTPTNNAQTAKVSWKQRAEQLDLFGTFVFVPMIVCLLLALQWGGSKYPWHDGRIIALFVVFGILLIAFIAIQFWKKDNATVPPRVISMRTVAAGCWFSLSLGAAFFIFVYYLPIWFQAIKDKSPVQSGIANIPMILSLVVISIIVGGVVTSLGWYQPFIVGSSVLMAIGAGLLATLDVNSGHSKWIGYQVVFGLGIGMGMQQTLVAVQAVLKPKDIPTGTALIMFAQLLGGALFISVAQNVFTNELIQNVTTLVPGLSPETVIATGATNLTTGIPAKYLAAVRLAYNGAIIDTFYAATAMAAISIVGAVFVEHKNIKGKKMEMAAA